MTSSAKSRILLAASCVCLAAAGAQANELLVTSAAALGDPPAAPAATCTGDGQPGPCGLEVVLTDPNNAFAVTSRPRQETAVKISFMLHPNDLQLEPAESVRFLKGFRRGAPDREHLVARILRSNQDNGYKMVVWQRQNFGFRVRVGTIWLTGDGGNPRQIEIVWKQGTGQQGSQDGTVQIFRDGVLLKERTDMNTSNYTLDQVKLGVFGLAGSTTTQATGSYYVDKFRIDRVF